MYRMILFPVLFFFRPLVGKTVGPSNREIRKTTTLQCWTSNAHDVIRFPFLWPRIDIWQKINFTNPGGETREKSGVCRKSVNPYGGDNAKLIAVPDGPPRNPILIILNIKGWNIIFFCSTERTALYDIIFTVIGRRTKNVMINEWYSGRGEFGVKTVVGADENKKTKNPPRKPLRTPCDFHRDDPTLFCFSKYLIVYREYWQTYRRADSFIQLKMYRRKVNCKLNSFNNCLSIKTELPRECKFRRSFRIVRNRIKFRETAADPLLKVGHIFSVTKNSRVRCMRISHMNFGRSKVSKMK